MNEPSIWREVFSPLAQAVAFFGGLGGLVHGLALKRTWAETARISIIGSATAFGFGIIGFQFLRWQFPSIPEDAAGTLGAVTAGAFFVGIIAVFLIETTIERFRKEAKSDQNAQG